MGGMRWSAALLFCLVLVACSGPDAAAPTGTAPPVSARVTAVTTDIAFPRTLQADRLVEANVMTVREADVVVTSARLESALFADSPPRDGVVRLFADWANRVRLPLGTPVCPAPAGPTRVVLALTVSGVATTEKLVVDDAVLRSINADECAQEAILDQAAPSFGPIDSESPAALQTSVILTRGTGKAPVTLTEVTGNIIFIVRVDPSASRTLAATQASLAVPVTVSVGRCDPHAFAESKKTFVFPAHLAVGDAEPAYVEFAPAADARAALQRLFDACGQARN